MDVQPPAPIKRRRSPRGLQGNASHLGPPGAPTPSQQSDAVKKQLLKYLRTHALLGENPSTAAAEALEETAAQQQQQDGGDLLGELIRTWDQTELASQYDEPAPLPAKATENVFTFLLQQQREKSQDPAGAASAGDTAERWRQLNSISAR